MTLRILIATALVALLVPRLAFAQTADAGVAATTDAGAPTETVTLPPPPPPVAPVAPPQDTAATNGGNQGGILSQSQYAGGVPPINENTSELTGTPNPSGLAPSATNEWRFSTHGYFRAPLRLGIGGRPQCPAGVNPGTPEAQPAGSIYTVPCAGPGQSGTVFHSPQVPDDQYLDWRYTRQLERDWAELFLNFGNSIAVATLGVQAYNFSDASFNNSQAQLGIAQGYVTITPDLGRKDVRINWKVGAFWEKFGQAGKYDAGKYDTYMFGRTHLYGETLGGEYDVKSFTFRLSQGVGAKPEQDLSGATGAGQYPPGFTLVAHEHAGISYKKILDVNLHDIYAFAQDARNSATPDGSMHVIGAEAHVWGGMFGDLYVAYSHVDANHVQAVGPGVEVLHSLGGGLVGGSLGGGANGLIENYLGACGGCSSQNLLGTGSVDAIEWQYDFSFGLLARKLKNPNIPGFWGDGWDVNLSFFGMYTGVTTYDVTMPTAKLKVGADLVVRPLKWFGFGVRFDDVQPSNLPGGDHSSFAVISPKLMFRSHWVSHEEITLQYTHYFLGSTIILDYPYVATTPPDADALTLKVTMWW